MLSSGRFYFCMCRSLAGVLFHIFIVFATQLEDPLSFVVVCSFAFKTFLQVFAWIFVDCFSYFKVTREIQSRKGYFWVFGSNIRLCRIFPYK